MILTDQEKRVLVELYSHQSETYIVAGYHDAAATRALSALNLLYIDEEVQIGSNTQQPVLRVSKSRNGQKEYDKDLWLREHYKSTSWAN